MRQSYYDSVLLIERLHRHFLEVMKAELDRQGIQDTNNVQALILYNIGDDELTVGELTARGYYLGSNVSYNVKKMVENDYLKQARSPHDRRSVRVRLSDKGLKLRRLIDKALDSQAEALNQHGIGEEQLSSACETLRKLERYWSTSLSYGGVHPTAFIA